MPNFQSLGFAVQRRISLLLAAAFAGDWQQATPLGYPVVETEHIRIFGTGVLAELQAMVDEGSGLEALSAAPAVLEDAPPRGVGKL
jgi:hypothetical protein